MRSAVATAVQTSVIKKTPVSRSSRSGKRWVNGTMRRKAKSTCTPGSITRSSFSSSISSRAVRSCLSSPVRSVALSNSRSFKLFTPWRVT
jgi:hypothetical protein